VLNALRHQRVGSVCPLPQVCVVRKVLNALRHQRVGSDAALLTRVRRLELCSTPYGIRGLDQKIEEGL